MKIVGHKNPLAKQLIKSRGLSVSTDETSSSLRVYSPAFYWEFIILVIGVLLFCFAIGSGYAKTVEGIVFIGISTLALVFIFAFGMMKRTVLSVFDKSNEELFHHQSGMYSTSLDASDREINFPDIRQVGIKRFVRRGGDSFLVFLDVKHYSVLNVTTSSLSFADAQKCAEIIREFVGIQERIQAVG